jgi:hypothetical protein
LFAELAALRQSNDKNLINHSLISQISAVNNNNNNNNNPMLVNSSSSSRAPSSFLIVQRSRGDNSTKSSLVVNVNHTYYTYEKKSEKQTSTPENNPVTTLLNKDLDIALIAPTFTAAAYDNSFYNFYKLYANTAAGRNVTSNLNLLSKKISNQDISAADFAMLKLINNIKLIDPHSNITLLTDASVDNGSIFTRNGENNIYHILILGHQEYVTQQEYNNLKKFVVNGGTLIILDGNVFFAQVKYDKHTQTVSLVKGHWWAFNGKSAWKSVGERWKQETSQWIGSNYLCYQCIGRFTNDPFGYRPHEEQYVTNHNDTIVLNYSATITNHPIHVKPVIATYELNYQKGKVVALGIYSDDIISNTKFDRFFNSLLLKYAPKIAVE